MKNAGNSGITSNEIRTKVEDLMKKLDDLRSMVELRSPKDLVSATENSVRGFRAVLFGEKAFRTDLVVFVITTAIAAALRFYGQISWCECAVMIYTVFVALVGEIINTAIETVVDRISTEYNELSGRAKDIGSAIVFVAFFGAGICWFVILLQLLIKYL